MFVLPEGRGKKVQTHLFQREPFLKTLGGTDGGEPFKRNGFEGRNNFSLQRRQKNSPPAKKLPVFIQGIKLHLYKNRYLTLLMLSIVCLPFFSSFFKKGFFFLSLSLNLTRFLSRAPHRKAVLWADRWPSPQKHLKIDATFLSLLGLQRIESGPIWEEGFDALASKKQIDGQRRGKKIIRSGK